MKKKLFDASLFNLGGVTRYFQRIGARKIPQRPKSWVSKRSQMEEIEQKIVAKKDYIWDNRKASRIPQNKEDYALRRREFTVAKTGKGQLTQLL